MKYTLTAAALVGFVLAAPALADDCAKKCVDEHNTCVAKPDANMAVCAAEFAGCLGYNPYDKQPYVEPTACANKSVTSPVHTPTAGPVPDDCAKKCIDTRNTCLTTPGSNKAVCAADFAGCLGYNPYDTQPYVEPTACRKATHTSVTSVKPTQTASRHDDKCQDGRKVCEDKHNQCIQKDINRSTCESDYAACLSALACHDSTVVTTVRHTQTVCSEDKCHPKPTVCTDAKCNTQGHAKPTNGITITTKNGPKPTTTGGPVIVSGAADNLKPGLAMLALGAAALL